MWQHIEIMQKIRREREIENNEKKRREEKRISINISCNLFGKKSQKSILLLLFQIKINENIKMKKKN